MALVTVVATPRGLLGNQQRGLAQWHTPREGSSARGDGSSIGTDRRS